MTMPHKEAILPLLEELDDATRISGSVNTVVVKEGGLHGANADGTDFVEACEESGGRLTPVGRSFPESSGCEVECGGKRGNR